MVVLDDEVIGVVMRIETVGQVRRGRRVCLPPDPFHSLSVHGFLASVARSGSEFHGVVLIWLEPRARGRGLQPAYDTRAAASEVLAPRTPFRERMARAREVVFRPGWRSALLPLMGRV